MSLKNSFKKVNKKLLSLVLGAGVLMSAVGCEWKDEKEDEEDKVYTIGSVYNEDADVIGGIPQIETLKNTGAKVLVVHVDDDLLEHGKKYSFKETYHGTPLCLYVDGSINEDVELTVEGGQLVVSHAVYSGAKIKVVVPSGSGYVQTPCIVGGVSTTCTEWMDQVAYYPYNAYATKYDPAFVAGWYVWSDVKVEITEGATWRDEVMFIRKSLNNSSVYGESCSPTEEKTSSEKDVIEDSLSSNYNSKSRVIIFAKKDAELGSLVKAAMAVVKKENEIKAVEPKKASLKVA